MWDEITYPFPYANSCTIEVWEWLSISFHIFYCMIYIMQEDFVVFMTISIRSFPSTKWHLIYQWIS